MRRREFEGVVDKVLDELPQWVVDRIENLVVVVEENPTFEQDPDGSLLGIYEGVSLLDRSGDYWGVTPDQITIFRRPHVDLGLTNAELTSEIRRTVLHEIGHYLGIDDARLHELGWD
jgi:predicted Zn-dependent protease with MMP-like domain